MATNRRPATGVRGLTAFANKAKPGDVMWLQIEDGDAPQALQSAVKSVQCKAKRYLATRLFIATNLDPGAVTVTAVRLLRVTAGEPLE